jgi:hypothetical protein
VTVSVNQAWNRITVHFRWPVSRVNTAGSISSHTVSIASPRLMP